MAGHDLPDVDQFLQGDAAGGKSAIGQDLFNLDGSLFGTLSVSQHGVVQIRFPNGVFSTFEGGEFVTVLGGKVDQVVRIDAGGNITRAVAASKFFPSPSTGSGVASTALTFPQEKELIELQQKFQLTEAERNRKFELELLKKQQQFQTGERKGGQKFTTSERRASQLFSAAEAAKARENAQRIALQQSINDLIGEAVGIRERSRQLLAETLGEDPFRAAAQLSGTAQRGTTPTQAFRNRLRPTARFEAPGVDTGANANIGVLQGQQGDLRDFVTQGLPIQPPAFGLARGGTVDTKRFGQTGESILVGESGPEVITFNDDRMTVTPLRGRAQFGGTFSFGQHGQGFNPSSSGKAAASGQPVNLFPPGTTLADLGIGGGNSMDPDAISSIQALAPLLESVGFEKAPIFKFGPAGGQTLIQEGLRGQPLGTGAETLQRLGTTRPRLVRDSSTGRIFLVGRDGTLQRFDSMAQFLEFGFNLNDVVNLSPQSMAELGLVGGGDAAALTEAPPLIEPGAGSRGVGEALSGPILAPIEFDEIGDPTRFVGLPDPASNIRAFNRQPLALQNMFSSLFELSGFGAESAQERRRFFTPSGSARQGTTLKLG